MFGKRVRSFILLVLLLFAPGMLFLEWGSMQPTLVVQINVLDKWNQGLLIGVVLENAARSPITNIELDVRTSNSVNISLGQIQFEINSIDAFSSENFNWSMQILDIGSAFFELELKGTFGLLRTRTNFILRSDTVIRIESLEVYDDTDSLLLGPGEISLLVDVNGHKTTIPENGFFTLESGQLFNFEESITVFDSNVISEPEMVIEVIDVMELFDTIGYLGKIDVNVPLGNGTRWYSTDNNKCSVLISTSSIHNVAVVNEASFARSNIWFYLGVNYLFLMVVILICLLIFYRCYKLHHI